MIISDLNHLEVVSEETNIVGGLVYNLGGRLLVLPSLANASAGARADTIANLSASTLTLTTANAVPGLFASSQSLSVAQGISL